MTNRYLLKYHGADLGDGSFGAVFGKHSQDAPDSDGTVTVVIVNGVPHLEQREWIGDEPVMTLKSLEAEPKPKPKRTKK